MINSPIILNGLSEILNKTAESLQSTHPDLRISGCDLKSKSIWIENFEYIDNGRKINQIYRKVKLESLVHPSGKKVKGADFRDLIEVVSFRLFLDDDVPVSFYKWEYKKSGGLLKKEDRIDLSPKCDISEALEKILDNIITEELPKFRRDSKEKTIADDQLQKIGSFEPLAVS